METISVYLLIDLSPPSTTNRPSLSLSFLAIYLLSIYLLICLSFHPPPQLFISVCLSSGRQFLSLSCPALYLYLSIFNRSSLSLSTLAFYLSYLSDRDLPFHHPCYLSLFLSSNRPFISPFSPDIYLHLSFNRPYLTFHHPS